MESQYSPREDQGLKPRQQSRRLSEEQVRLLENSFKSNHKLHAEHKLQLATRLGVSPRQVAIWYQNRRARHRTQTIEFDYRTIQMRLDHTLAAKRSLEKEVAMLKAELFTAREMLRLTPHSDEHNQDSSSELHQENVAVGEELYTCLSPW